MQPDRVVSAILEAFPGARVVTDRVSCGKTGVCIFSRPPDPIRPNTPVHITREPRRRKGHRP
jgi:hypothetical protein